MKKNLGNADRIIRTALAIFFGALYFTGTVTGTLGLVLMLLGGVFLVTSFLGICPLYTLVGLNTRPTDRSARIS
jgi:glucokinase